jgi:hypothetical protein
VVPGVASYFSASLLVLLGAKGSDGEDARSVTPPDLDLTHLLAAGKAILDWKRYVQED